MYLVKNLETLNLHPILIEIVNDLEEVAGPGLYTSAYRPGDDGVHGMIPVRGIDRRCRDSAIGNACKQYLNRKWVYDSDRPEMDVCIFHKISSYGWHLHMQCHPNTRRK